MENFKKVFSAIPDPRIERCKKHLLEDIILLTIISVICGAESWESIEHFGKSRKEFLKQVLKLPNGIPSHDTIERLFKRLNSVAFNTSFVQWTDMLREKTQGQFINVDGKSVNGSQDKINGKYAIHLVSAWCGSNQLVLGQIKTEKKINEIAAIKELLQLIDLEHCVITIDAMGCQKEIVKQIVQHKADYVIAVKDNQATLKQEMEALFNALKPASIDEQVEKSHGRIEKRKCETLTDLTLLDCKQEWVALNSISKITSTRTIQDKTTQEIRYYISSKTEHAKYFNGAIRNHWGIENSLHWILDVQFHEDHVRKRKDHAAENFAIIRRFALNLIRKHPYQRLGVNYRRLLAGWNDQYLLKLLKN